jgi:peroxiredoxin
MQQTPNAPARDQKSHIPIEIVQVRKSFIFAFLGLAILLSVTNVLLILQNRDQRETLQAFRNQLELQPGNFMPPVSGKDAHGNPLVVGYGQDKKKTVMLVFSPKCRICDENWPNWQRTLRAADKEGARVVAVNLASTLARDYLDQHGLAGRDVIAQADPNSILAYNLRYTPQTIVIGPDAKVQWVWTGSLSSEHELELSNILRNQPASPTRSETMN